MVLCGLAMAKIGIRFPLPAPNIPWMGVYMKFSIMNAVATGTAILAMVAAVIGADSRYVKSDDLQQAKNEIINEMRYEVSKNRAVMIASMQRNADDIEFQIAEIEQEGNKAPRFLIEKHRQITRQIEDLKAVDKEKKK